MSYLENYRKRLKLSAGMDVDDTRTPSKKDMVLHQSKQSQRRAFYNSPTLIDVIYDGEITPVIKSDKYKDIELQTFLFEPDTPVKIGTVIVDGEYTYLSTNKNGETVFPELVAKLCNDTFEIPMGTREEVTYNRDGFPIYTTVPLDPEEVPAVISDKDYSTSSNAIVPLPSGRINMELPYKPEYLEHFKVNFQFEHGGGDYKVTDIRVVKITPYEKYIKVSATRVVSDE